MSKKERVKIHVLNCRVKIDTYNEFKKMCEIEGETMIYVMNELIVKKLRDSK